MIRYIPYKPYVPKYSSQPGFPKIPSGIMHGHSGVKTNSILNNFAKLETMTQYPWTIEVSFEENLQENNLAP